MYVKGETIDEILRCCVCVENLTLSNSFGFKNIEIRNPNLKFLELNGLCMDHIVISAERLEVLLLASITCLVRNVVIVAPKLREFQFFGSRKIPASYPPELGTQDLLGYYNGLLDSKMGNTFMQKLSSLSMGLDLNSFLEALLLSHILRTSVDLQTLKIIIPVAKTTERKIPRDPCYRCPSFWEERETCDCVGHKLRFVYIEGFTGMELEVEFIKYLIRRSTNMKMITIVCNSLIEDADELLSLKCASTNLSIKVKEATKSSSPVT